jgi:hypothetical protein
VVGVARLHHAEHLAVSIRQTSETPVNKPPKAAVVQTISSTTREEVGDEHTHWMRGENKPTKNNTTVPVFQYNIPTNRLLHSMYQYNQPTCNT